VSYADKAEEIFKSGLNCAQAVAAAFSELYDGVSEQQIMEISSPFGGGFGRKRELCGAVSGMGIAYGLIKGTHKPEDKNYTYQKVSALADIFSARYESLVCGTLLRNSLKLITVSGEKMPELETVSGKPWPCVGYVRGAAEILEEYLREQDSSKVSG